MRPNAVKEKLRNGETVVGCFVQYPSPETVEIIGLAGFDYVLIDCEHGPMTPETTYPMVLAAEARDTVAMVRVPVNSHQEILRYMDIGTMGVMAPQINSREDAEAMVRAVKYHPGGRRGMAGVRASGWAINTALPDFTDLSNRETIVMALFENITAIEQVPDILAVEGIDILYVGPNDLAQSMGLPGQIGHPDVQAVIDRVCEMAKGTGVALGTVAPNAEAATQLIERGFQVIGANSATLLASASREMLAGIHR